MASVNHMTRFLSPSLVEFCDECLFTVMFALYFVDNVRGKKKIELNVGENCRNCTGLLYRI